LQGVKRKNKTDLNTGEAFHGGNESEISLYRRATRKRAKSGYSRKKKTNAGLMKERFHGERTSAIMREKKNVSDVGPTIQKENRHRNKRERRDGGI